MTQPLYERSVVFESPHKRSVCELLIVYTGFRLQRVWLKRAPGYNEQICLHQNQWQRC